jgi:uncharacterized membrane protein YdjX (TVP38/TMEM64 family)
MINNTQKIIRIVKTHWVAIVAITLVLAAVIFLYFDRGNQVSTLIVSWGVIGIVFAILLMAAIFMTPVPSEGLVIIYLKIYGLYLGSLYSWIGSVAGSFALFFLARRYGQNLVKKLITQDRFEIVNTWVAKKGLLGLIISRLVPIPLFFVNFIVGTMPSIKLWPYLWTAAIAIIPYFVVMAMIYAGIVEGTLSCVFIGVILGICGLMAGYLILKKAKG